MFYVLKNETTNIKEAISLRIPDLRDIFANELAIWCSKLLFGYGSANIRICEYKNYGRITFLPKYARMVRSPDVRDPDLPVSTLTQYRTKHVTTHFFKCDHVKRGPIFLYIYIYIYIYTYIYGVDCRFLMCHCNTLLDVDDIVYPWPTVKPLI